jgi:hypothetical protein
MRSQDAYPPRSIKDMPEPLPNPLGDYLWGWLNGRPQSDLAKAVDPITGTMPIDRSGASRILKGSKHWRSIETIRALADLTMVGDLSILSLIGVGMGARRGGYGGGKSRTTAKLPGWAVEPHAETLPDWYDELSIPSQMKVRDMAAYLAKLEGIID